MYLYVNIKPNDQAQITRTRIEPSDKHELHRYLVQFRRKTYHYRWRE